MSKIKGGDMMLFLNSKSIAYATSHTLTISGDTQDTSNKDEGGGDWASNEISKLSWTAQSENMYSIDGKGSNFDDLFDIMVAKTPVSATFSKKKETDTDVPETGWTASKPDYEGKVIITSLVANANNGENATYSVTLTGTGSIKKTTTPE